MPRRKTGIAPMTTMVDQIAINFGIFHRKNPEVYELFDRFARKMLRGSKHGAAKLIFERIRWHVTVDVITEDPPKLNNNFTALYARLWEERNPTHIGFFRKRERRTDTVDSTDFDLAEEDLL